MQFYILVGWWKYDERSNIELETAFNNRDPECTLLLAGALYSIDFQNMTQIRCSDPTRRRHVRRDTSLFPAKGTMILANIIQEPNSKFHNENYIVETWNVLLCNKLKEPPFHHYKLLLWAQLFWVSTTVLCNPV